MKRFLTALLLVSALLAALVLPAAAADGIAGRYNAVSCVKDGTSYKCEDEYLILSENGSGVVNFNGVEYGIRWETDGDEFFFTDEEDYTMRGTVAGDAIVGTYAGYDYIYEREGAEDAAGTDAPAETAPPVTAVDDGKTAGTYYAVRCTRGEMEYNVSREYLILNEDGSGVATTGGYSRSFAWTQEGERISFRDNMGDEMTGTVSGGQMRGEWQTYTYIWEKNGSDAPIMGFAPTRWNAGLPNVCDEADILSDEEESRLSAKAEELSGRFGCTVYIVTADNFKNYTLSDSVEVFTEELRAGYHLGAGAEQEMVLLCLSMAERDFDLMANGSFGNRSFTDYGKEYMQKKFLDNFANNDWYGGFSDYLDQCGDLMQRSADGKPFDVGDNPLVGTVGFLISLGLAAIIAILISNSLRRGMRTTKEQTQANSYIVPNGVVITRRIDQFTHTTETRVYDPPESKSSGGGGGGGTHISGGGSSHSSGKF